MKHGSQTTPLQSRLAAPRQAFHKETAERNGHMSLMHTCTETLTRTNLAASAHQTIHSHTYGPVLRT